MNVFAFEDNDHNLGKCFFFDVNDHLLAGNAKVIYEWYETTYLGKLAIATLIGDMALKYVELIVKSNGEDIKILMKAQHVVSRAHRRRHR